MTTMEDYQDPDEMLEEENFLERIILPRLTMKGFFHVKPKPPVNQDEKLAADIEAVVEENPEKL